MTLIIDTINGGTLSVHTDMTWEQVEKLLNDTLVEFITFSDHVYIRRSEIIWVRKEIIA